MLGRSWAGPKINLPDNDGKCMTASQIGLIIWPTVSAVPIIVKEFFLAQPMNGQIAKPI